MAFRWKFAAVLAVMLVCVDQALCQTCTQGEVRLVNGANQYEGRVEVCNSNEWGTVCDDFFSRLDSAVVCRQLGFSYAGASTPTRAFFGEGTGRIWLDNVGCRGTEARLVDCPHPPFGSHNCGHNEDVGVRCIPEFYCTDGDIRLVDGRNELEGRVEVCFNGTWGTVCDDFWSSMDANVACRQLGFSSTGAQSRASAAFGQGVGDIFLDNVVCDGNELRLIDCASNPLAAHNCVHSEDAGVVCQPATSPCTQGDIRLVAGARDSEGRVEVCNQNQWGSVCDMSWDMNDGHVACRQAGFGSASAVLSNAAYGEGTGPIWMSGLACGTTQLSLFSCTRSPSVPTSCRHADDASVRCQGLATGCTAAQQGNIRLANGSTPYEGRVEMCYNGQWGTVCDDGWGGNDAGVACKQLGFSPWAATNVNRAGFGQGTGLPIVMDDVGCSGSSVENRLIDCPARLGSSSHNCAHSEDAGVICVPAYTPGPDVICSTGDVRLVGGSNPLEGRLEVCYFNQWGTICSSNMSSQVAQVACRQLGYVATPNSAAPANATLAGQGDGPIIANAACNGTENALMDCPFSTTHGCVHGNDLALRCTAISTGCTDGAIRLAGGGRSSSQGRVEVCNNDQWGTVCDDTWNSLDASVACVHLGYSVDGATGQRRAEYGQGTGPILLDQVRCTGNETNIFDCPQNPIGQHDCSHFEDAGVTCTAVCHDGDLRLVGGRSPNEGRLEFCYGGVWGTVCRDLWGTPDATVACRQLGFLDFDVTVILNATLAGFGVATGPVLIDETRCIGNEIRLINCRHNGIGTHNCAHSRDVGLRCVVPNCEVDGELRLADGSGPNEGRVEVCYRRVFGTVCGDAFWDTTDAQVVCRQLGYPIEGATALRVAAVFGPGTGRVWLGRPQCTLNDTVFSNCTFGSALGNTGCGHSNDAGVICFTQFGNCTEGDVRLVDGNNRYEGRVEICHNNIWGTVCQDFFFRPNSAVVCRQLGLGYAGASTPTQAHFGDGSGKPVWLDNVVCRGTENNLIDCQANPLGSSNCGHDKDVGTRCLPIFNCTDGEIRLVGGSNFLEGRVEVCINGTWGTVCDDLWGPEEASVACNQLGFSPIGAIARPGAAFGQGSGGVFLDNVVCDGFERRLVDCASNPPASSNCPHTKDAGVVCQAMVSPCTEQAVRFVAGPDVDEGRLEVCYRNQWGSVCDRGFDTNDARSACRQAGYSGESFESEYFGSARFGGGSGPIWMSDLTCSGTETSLFSCTSNTPLGSVQNTTTCTHLNDVSVRCSGYTPVCTREEQGYVRLVNGSTPYEGRVEVCNAGQWGTVCDDAWDANDAGVVCRQLGFSPWASTPIVRAGYGQGTDPIWLDNLGCSGREDSLIDCRRNPLGSHNCLHSDDAGVICAPLFVPGPDVICVTGDVRLVGGSNPLEGRLEVCYFNQWGTICSGTWGQNEAGVVCGQLGYARTGAAPLVATDFFGRGDGPIAGNNVMCRGDEDRIIDCMFDRNHNCGHENDVAVRCMTSATGCTDGAIRLAGSGSSSSQGRVEVCNNNQWGTVCDDTWNSLDASVACFHLGYSNEGASGQRGATYGQGSGPILLDQVQCFGNESDIFDCPQNDIGMHNCVHDQDAGVTCTARCHDGDLRLVGGRNASEGRLEFCYGGVWGTVCRDQWGIPDAGVACRQLGFPSEGAVVILNASEAGFGVPTGPVLYDEANCLGTEDRLANCRHNGIGTFNCDHSRDVGLRCQIESPQLVITPSNHSLLYQDPLRVTCVTSAGSQVSYGIDPTTIVWLDANGQLIIPEAGQVTITERTGVVEGVVFVESVLDMCSTSFRHYGQMRCNARRVVGEDIATFNVVATDVVPAQLVETPGNQSVDCNTGVGLSCSAIGFPAPTLTWWFNGSIVDDASDSNVDIQTDDTQMNSTSSVLTVMSFGSENIGYYVCSAQNPIGNPMSDPARVVIDLATAPPVLAPVITSVGRTAADEAQVEFDPQSLGTFNVRYYFANDTSTPDLSQSQYIGSVRTDVQQPQATLSGLDTCTNYWVTITASYCGRMSTTGPQLTGIKDATPYQLDVLLSDDTCSDWIKIDPDSKLRDMETGLQTAAASCGVNALEIPCFIGSSWMCSDGDDKKLTFQTQIVGDNSVKASDLTTCINQWLVSGAAQSFMVGGVILMVPPPEVPEPSTLPFWIWIIVGVVGGLILFSLLVVCCIVCCVACRKNRDKSMKPFPTVVMSKKDEQLIKKGDDVEEEDRYSVAVVDNPIYDVDPDEKAGTVAYYKSGQDDDDEEALVKLDLGDAI